MLINYYRMIYACGYKNALVHDKLNNNIGEMRHVLERLHFNEKNLNYQIALLRTICDYIAGMTDKYAMEKQRELYNIEYK